jgi:hypothetical protein
MIGRRHRGALHHETNHSSPSIRLVHGEDQVRAVRQRRRTDNLTSGQIPHLRVASAKLDCLRRSDDRYESTVGAELIRLKLAGRSRRENMA